MKVMVTDRGGATMAMDGRPGASILEIVQGGGSNDLPGICGGCKSCATCHIFIAPEWVGRLKPADEHERDLLESSAFNSDHSRLACQVVLASDLDGLALTIAPEG